MEPSVPAWVLVDRLGDDEVVVVDIRGAEEARRIPLQIPGAIRMSLQEIHEYPHTLPDDELIILYDGDGGFLAKRAWRLLQLSGRSAAVLDGGLKMWLSGGYPTESVQPLQPARRGCVEGGISLEASANDGH